ncbi:MAG: DUF2851 family protein [Tannerella sp.]|jgi:hypothetical protein|nr:DUF2851 family protein [Tannerella sp.]
MERLLQYIWKYRLYTDTELCTAEGLPVSVIDPGIQNTDAGPDFFNAKIRIADTVWAGNVEIHGKSSDWQNHRHNENPAYDSVILHVVEEYDEPACRTNGEVIPHAVIRVPPGIRQNMEWLLSRDTALPCAERIGEIESLHVSAWMSALLTERLERKTRDILMLLKEYANDWNEVFYITLMRNFGFGVNSDAFEWLAKSLPLKYLLKQRCSSLQIEALLFGQAGLLLDDNPDPYYQSLQREYVFLKEKYGLHPQDGHLIKSMRMRPVNFPHLRLAQLAAVWANNDTLFSKMLECNDFRTLLDCFDTPLSEYWDTHYHFKFASPAKKKTLGVNAAHIIMINTVVPILFAYGKVKSLPEYGMRALQILENIPPERNSLVAAFTNAGIKASNACDTQALIQLRREYCEKKKCLYCRIGFRIVKSGRTEPERF